MIKIKKTHIGLFLLTLASCTQSGKTTLEESAEDAIQEYVPNQKAVSLNDSAVYLLSQTMMFQDSLNASLNKQALKFLNQAFEIDSMYELAYSNKVDVLKNLGRYQDAIKTLKYAVRVIDNYAEAYSTQGFLYEKIGKVDSADLMYNAALKVYQNRLSKSPDNIDERLNLAFLVIFTNNKTEALYEVEDIIEATGSQQANDFKSVIKNLDREQFIKNF